MYSDHPLALGLRLDSRLCTTERGSYTEISATNSRFRTYEGRWLPFGVDLHYVPLLITEQMLIHKM